MPWEKESLQESILELGVCAQEGKFRVIYDGGG